MQLVDKSKTTVHFWVDLGNTSVVNIDGIGDVLGSRFFQIGITTVGQLRLARTADVASALRVSETRAQAFVDAAGLMSRLSIVGFEDEIVELLVKGAGVRSVEQLAETEPTGLYRLCRSAVESGKVKVPRSFAFTAEDTAGWVKAARVYLGK